VGESTMLGWKNPMLGQEKMSKPPPCSRKMINQNLWDQNLMEEHRASGDQGASVSVYKIPK
jgi:hypothetical protein